MIEITDGLALAGRRCPTVRLEWTPAV